jgi:hypothetical protein
MPIQLRGLGVDLSIATSNDLIEVYAGSPHFGEEVQNRGDQMRSGLWHAVHEDARLRPGWSQ